MRLPRLFSSLLLFYMFLLQMPDVYTKTAIVLPPNESYVVQTGSHLSMSSVLVNFSSDTGIIWEYSKDGKQFKTVYRNVGNRPGYFTYPEDQRLLVQTNSQTENDYNLTISQVAKEHAGHYSVILDSFAKSQNTIVYNTTLTVIDKAKCSLSHPDSLKRANLEFDEQVDDISLSCAFDISGVVPVTAKWTDLSGLDHDGANWKTVVSGKLHDKNLTCLVSTSSPPYPRYTDNCTIGPFTIFQKPKILDFKVSKVSSQPLAEGHTELSGVQLGDKNVTLSCLAGGFPTPSVRWYRYTEVNKSRGNEFPPGSDLHINQLTPEESGPYLCEATNVIRGVRYSTNKTLPLLMFIIGDGKNTGVSPKPKPKARISSKLVLGIILAIALSLIGAFLVLLILYCKRRRRLTQELYPNGKKISKGDIECTKLPLSSEYKKTQQLHDSTVNGGGNKANGGPSPSSPELAKLTASSAEEKEEFHSIAADQLKKKEDSYEADAAAGAMLNAEAKVAEHEEGADCGHAAPEAERGLAAAPPINSFQ